MNTTTVKVKTKLRAGGTKGQHASSLKVRTKLRAGQMSANHGQTVR